MLVSVVFLEGSLHALAAVSRFLGRLGQGARSSCQTLARAITYHLTTHCRVTDFKTAAYFETRYSFLALFQTTRRGCYDSVTFVEGDAPLTLRWSKK